MRAPGNLATEGGRFEIEDFALAADHIAVEIDLDVEAETAGGGAQFGEGAAMFDAHGLENLDKAARGGQMADADAVDRLDEGRGRTIHDRHFRPIDFDQAIIDAETVQGGDQMLYGADHVLRAVADDGAKFGHGDFGPVRLDAPAAAVGQTAAQKNQAGMGVGRIENQADGLAGMNANASGERDAVPESGLKIRLHLRSVCSPRSNGGIVAGPLFAADDLRRRGAHGERKKDFRFGGESSVERARIPWLAISRR